jgi:hypothetical protein
MRKPLNEQNEREGQDARNVFNPNKIPNPSNLYAQSNIQTNAEGLRTADISTNGQNEADTKSIANASVNATVNATANATQAVNAT